MAKYRKIPVVIDAAEYTGDISIDLRDILVGSCHDIFDDKIEIVTLEGTMTASIGDFIIKGVQGEIYPCKPDIFADTYQAVKAVSKPMSAEDFEKVLDEAEGK